MKTEALAAEAQLQQYDTLPKLLLRNAEQLAERDAMREKQYGIWQTYTWRDYADEVRRFALGLAALGFQRGDKLAVIGDNRPQLYFSMLAAQSLGGISMALYQDSIAKELSYIIAHSETRFIVAENQEQVDKLIEIKTDIANVEQVVYDDPRGLETSDDPWLIHFPEVQRRGDEFAHQQPDYFTHEVSKGSAGDIAIFSYTSGTTGMPKGVMLSHKNLISGPGSIVRSEGWNRDDEILAYLPMAWIGDFTFSVAGPLIAGITVSCPESAESYRFDVREIGPTLFVGPPRGFENTLTFIQVRMEEADWLKRRSYNYFMDVALRVEKLQQSGQPVPFKLALLNNIGKVLVRDPLRDMVGAGRVRMAYTGGAPLGPDVMDFFRSMGANLKQIYAMTECAATCTIQPDGQANVETVGPPLPGVEIKIADNGEVLMRGDMVFQGYFKNEEATRSALDSEGWLATGDAGFIDKSGHLKVIDRAKDVSRLKDQTLFAPQFLENKLKFSPYIKEAVVLGSERDYVAAMINIDLDALESWPSAKGWRIPVIRIYHRSRKSTN